MLLDLHLCHSVAKSTFKMSSLTYVAFITPTPLVSSSSSTTRHRHRPQYKNAEFNHQMCTAAPTSKSKTHDVIIIGSGIGGLSAAALLTAYGKKPLILESHSVPGGAAHGFSVKTSRGKFDFDTGPSFFCALSSTPSLNPLTQALSAVNAEVKCTAYDHFIIDDMKYKKCIKMYDEKHKTVQSITDHYGVNSGNEMNRFYNKIMKLYQGMKIPSIALRGDWLNLGLILSHRQKWLKHLLTLLPYVNLLTKPISYVMNQVDVTDGNVKFLLDIECFLLSGLKTNGTITAEIAFMFGERFQKGKTEYPINGTKSIIDELVAGILAQGGELRLNCHVDEILIDEKENKAIGVRLRKSNDILVAPLILCNASVWDTLHHLIPYETIRKLGRLTTYKSKVDKIPVINSFMHLHIAIPSNGLKITSGHHVLITDSDKDISQPGNTIMLSIPTTWSESIAPEGWHVIHAYTLEIYEKWPAIKAHGREHYEMEKLKSAQPLFHAVRYVIPDLDDRLGVEGSVCKIGSPLTHEKFNRRYKGSYGAGIVAASGLEFEWPDDIPVKGLKRCGGDSTFPGIGVPAAAAAGLICVNELFGADKHVQIIDKIFPKRFDDMV